MSSEYVWGVAISLPYFWLSVVPMERWCGKTAFVTGASAGIGYDISKQLCELGMNVVGCARNIEKIEVRKLCKEIWV